MNLALLYHLLAQKQREQQAQQLSLGNGFQGQVTLEDMMRNSDRYGRLIDQHDRLGEQAIRDSRVHSNIEKSMGEPMPNYFMERYWINQGMDQRLKDLMMNYKKGGI